MAILTDDNRLLLADASSGRVFKLAPAFTWMYLLLPPLASLSHRFSLMGAVRDNYTSKYRQQGMPVPPTRWQCCGTGATKL